MSDYQPARQYTPHELAAAKRLGLFPPGPDLRSGPLYWATGPYWPNEARSMAERARKRAVDAEVVAIAMDREWALFPGVFTAEDIAAIAARNAGVAS